MKEEGKIENLRLGMRERVMREIKERHLRMTRHWVFLAKKLNLESGLVSAFLLGVLLVSLTLFFFEETKLLRFLSLGWPGFKVFLSSLPYSYLILLGAAVFAAIYLANKLDIPCQINTACHTIALYFIAAVVIFGVLFVFLGINRIIKGWHGEISKDRAIWGKIKSVSKEGILLEDKNGNLIKVIIEKDLSPAEKKLEYEEGKFLRAAGFREKDNDNFFHAQRVRCCEDD